MVRTAAKSLPNLNILFTEPYGTNFNEFWIKRYETFLPWKCIWKYRLQNIRHSIQVKKCITGVPMSIHVVRFTATGNGNIVDNWEPRHVCKDINKHAFQTTYRKLICWYSMKTLRCRWREFADDAPTHRVMKMTTHESIFHSITLRPEENDRHFADNTFKCLLNGNHPICLNFKTSLFPRVQRTISYHWFRWCLALQRRQAITWSNDSQVQWRICVIWRSFIITLTS